MLIASGPQALGLVANAIQWEYSEAVAAGNGRCGANQAWGESRMGAKRSWLILLVVLALAAVLLLTVACGEEEGREARATADELAEDAGQFAEGFCAGGTATPAMIVLAALAVRSRKSRP